MRTFVTTGAIGRMGHAVGNQEGGWHVPGRHNSTDTEDRAFAELEASVDRLKKTLAGIDLKAIEKAVSGGLQPLVHHMQVQNAALVEETQRHQRAAKFAMHRAPMGDDDPRIQVENAQIIEHAQRKGFLLPQSD